MRSKRFRGLFCVKKPISEVLDARKMGLSEKTEDHFARVQKYGFLVQNATETLASQLNETLYYTSFCRSQIRKWIIYSEGLSSPVA